MELFGDREPKNMIAFTDDLRFWINLYVFKRKKGSLRCSLHVLCLINSYSALFYLFVECRDH
jgi:hypothetical protein